MLQKEPRPSSGDRLISLTPYSSPSTCSTFTGKNPNMWGQLCRFLARTSKQGGHPTFANPTLRSAQTTLFAFDLEHKKTNPMEGEEEEVMRSCPIPTRLPFPWVVPL